MPLYEFSCPQCKENVDILSGMEEDRSNVRCPICGGPLIRVFGNTAIVIPEYFRSTDTNMSPAEIGNRLNKSRPSGKRRSVY